MTQPLTLMAVHAHPDDEASSTGGVLAKYSDEGVRTIVVTCTNGEFGDGPSGIKPGDDGHDTADVAQTRLAELREAGATLLIVEQDLRRAMAACDDLVCLLEGRVVLAAPVPAVTREQVVAAYFGLRSREGRT